METYICATCGQQFNQYPSTFSRRKGTERYCSRKCAAQRQQKAMADLVCPMCGKVFYRKPSERKSGKNYCSRTCSNQAQSKILQELPPESRKFPGIEKTCEGCGKTYYTEPHRAAKSKYCSRPCALTSRFGPKEKKVDVSGNKNPNFRGTSNRTTARDNALRYLGRACMICGWDTIVDVHHIIPRRHGGTNDIDNLIVLCPNHHKMADKHMLSEDKLKSVTLAAIAQLSDRLPQFHLQSLPRDETVLQPLLSAQFESANQFD